MSSSKIRIMKTHVYCPNIDSFIAKMANRPLPPLLNWPWVSTGDVEERMVDTPVTNSLNILIQNKHALDTLQCMLDLAWEVHASSVWYLTCKTQRYQEQLANITCISVLGISKLHGSVSYYVKEIAGAVKSREQEHPQFRGSAAVRRTVRVSWCTKLPSWSTIRVLWFQKLSLLKHTCMCVAQHV